MTATGRERTETGKSSTTGKRSGSNTTTSISGTRRIYLRRHVWPLLAYACLYLHFAFSASVCAWKLLPCAPSAHLFAPTCSPSRPVPLALVSSRLPPNLPRLYSPDVRGRAGLNLSAADKVDSFCACRSTWLVSLPSSGPILAIKTLGSVACFASLAAAQQKKPSVPLGRRAGQPSSGLQLGPAEKPGFSAGPLQNHSRECAGSS